MRVYRKVYTRTYRMSRPSGREDVKEGLREDVEDGPELILCLTLPRQGPQGLRAGPAAAKVKGSNQEV